MCTPHFNSSPTLFRTYLHLLNKQLATAQRRGNERKEKPPLAQRGRVRIECMQPGLRPRLKSRPSLVELLSRARDDQANELSPAFGATSSPSPPAPEPPPPPLYLDSVEGEGTRVEGAAVPVSSGATREGPLIAAGSSSSSPNAAVGSSSVFPILCDDVAQASVRNLFHLLLLRHRHHRDSLQPRTPYISQPKSNENPAQQPRPLWLR